MTSSHFSTDYDAIVVGAGLTGLILARNLRQKGSRVLLVERKEHLGGALRPDSSVLRWAMTPHIIPASPLFASNWSFFQSVLEQEIATSLVELTPKTFESSQLKDFIGFGDRPFKSINFLSAYNTSQWHLPESLPAAWVERLIAADLGSVQTLSEVTTIKKESEGFRVILNGAKTTMVQSVYFTPGPQRLLTVMDREQIPTKISSRLGKMKPWSMVSLGLQHKALEQDPGFYFLYGGSNEFEPTFGCNFVDAQNQHLSCWMTYLPPESAEDHEVVGQALRHLKKTLKKALPHLAESLLSERISLSSEASVEVPPQIKDLAEIPSLENLYLASPLLSPNPGIHGLIDRARAILAPSTPEPFAERPCALEGAPQM